MTQYMNNWKTTIAFLLTTVMFSALIIAPNALAATGYTWTDDSTTDTATDNQDWVSITSSSNGQDLAAVASYHDDAGISGSIWTSTNGGANWRNDSTTDTATDKQVWDSITSSSNGRDLAAVAGVGGIWTSTDGGANWRNDSTTDTATAKQEWSSITSSSNGQDLAAVTLNGDIWTSTDGGANWTNDSATDTATDKQVWDSITSSSNGRDLAAVAGYDDAAGISGSIWTSTDGGANWTNDSATDTATAKQYWTSITSSSNGQDLAAVTLNGDIWTSTDGGANWTNDSTTDTATAKQYWTSITSSSNGQDLAAVTDGDSIWTSTDGGANWTNDSATDTATDNQDWHSITSSSNGQDLAAVAGYSDDAGISGSIWTTNNHSRPSSSNLVVEILVIGLVVVIGLGLFLLYRHKKIVKR